MNKEILIREIDQLLAKDKVKFLNNLKADIYNYVSNRSCAECLTIVKMVISGNLLTHWMGISLDLFHL